MNNLASIFIDPTRFGGADFAADLEAYADWMTARLRRFRAVRCCSQARSSAALQ